jgi:SAM-dependent methyltransferase
MGHFSLGLARLVGDEGTVIAADVQEKMLAKTDARARRAGLSCRIKVHPCGAREIGVGVGVVDFVLAFWMVHEVPAPAGFLRELRACLRPGGKILVAEPRLHVSSGAFRRTIEVARGAGLRVCATPRVALSRSVVLEVDPEPVGETTELGPAASPRRPWSPRRIAGVALLGVSFVLGWPAVALAGILALRWGQPAVVAVGGPVLLVIAHLVFSAGVYLAGGDRLLAALRRHS